MKVIVCSGDSHTCGQGADSILSKNKPSNPLRVYNHEHGKGIGGTCSDMVLPTYVNLIREYVNEHTGSQAGCITASELSVRDGCVKQPNVLNKDVVKLLKPLVLENQWDMLAVCVCEQVEEAAMEVYLDGTLSATHTLVTPIPRYNEYSYRVILIPCAGVKEVKLVPTQGEVLLYNIQWATGKYIVINSGVGWCPSDRYREECFDYCIADLKPDIVIAEAHTINDWLALESPQAHYDSLKALVEKIQALDAKVLFSTVSPIAGPQHSKKFGLLYQDYMDISKKIGELPGVLYVDSNAAFEKEMAGMTEEERFDYMHVDNWHVNARGHKIYADMITAKLAEILE